MTYRINLDLTSHGWQISSELDKIFANEEPVKFQMSYKGLLDQLQSMPISKRDTAPSYFTISMSFKPSGRKTFRLGLDYERKPSATALHTKLGLELFNNLSGELMKETED